MESLEFLDAFMKALLARPTPEQWLAIGRPSLFKPTTGGVHDQRVPRISTWLDTCKASMRGAHHVRLSFQSRLAIGCLVTYRT